MVHFEQESAALKNTLLKMASYAESAVNRAVEALTTRNHELALRVNEDDEIIDHFEVEIDETAIRLLAKAPPAGELRLITVAMKVSQNLERVGDEAAKIAKRARDLNQEAPLKLALGVPRLAQMALQLVKGALDAFVNQDPAAARVLIPQDKAIDALNKQIHRQLADQMIESPETITRCLGWMVVAKSLERIADHGKNIAEEVVYLYEARDIRHTGKAKAAPSEGQDTQTS
jgi:phosphate transport system protein